jgi:integrase
MDYRFNEKRKTLSLGAYPAVSLKDARARRDEAREILAGGVDPGAKKKADKAVAKAAAKEASRTFAVVAGEWLATRQSGYAPSHVKKLNWIIGLFRDIAGKPISRIEPGDILSCIRPVEASGHIVTAHKMAQAAGQVCRFARRCGYCTFNAADGLTEALRPIKTRHYAAITEPVEIGHLLRAIDAYPGSFSVLYALKIEPYVFLRSTELRLARWNEIDLEAAIWTIPGTRNEAGGGMKMRQPHIVPLARQVVSLFRELRRFSDGGLCFPSAQNARQAITDMALLNALRRMGYTREQMTFHGFRAMFSTRINEKKSGMGIDADVIELQLAHAPKNAVRAAYNHAEYLPQRADMMQAWADYLGGLRTAGMNP